MNFPEAVRLQPNGPAIVLALGLNVITGITGQLSLGHAVFMSIGAFTSALITTKTALPFGLNLLSCSAASAGSRRRRR
nr:hypothetical protein [Geobacter sp.]